MRDADIASVMRIASENNLSFWSENDYRAELKRPEAINLTAVSKEKREIAGFLVSRLITSENAIEVYNIAVDKKHQRKGVGKMLIRHLIETSQKNKINNIFLEVRSLNNAAIGFYNNAKFKRIGVRKHFYQTPSDDALLLKLDIKF